MTTRISLSALALAGTLALTGCAGAAQPAAPAPAPASSMSKPMESAPMMKGAFVTYDQYSSSMAMYEASMVVLFFHAPWCPDCKKTEMNLTSSGVPEGVTVVKVDYDSATELKARYGITKQHTFVLIDKDGMAKKTFTGTFDGASIKDALA